MGMGLSTGHHGAACIRVWPQATGGGGVAARCPQRCVAALQAVVGGFLYLACITNGQAALLPLAQTWRVRVLPAFQHQVLATTGR
jgi:hypothetical protein